MEKGEELITKTYMSPENGLPYKNFINSLASLVKINHFSDEERDEKLKRKKEKELKEIYKVSIYYYFNILL